MTKNADLTALDLVAVVAASVSVLALLAFPLIASSFAAVFRDLGGELPLFTRIVLLRWPQPIIGLVAAAAVAFGLRAERPLRIRRIAIAGAFTLAFFTFTASTIGLYLPIFALSGQIRAD